LEKWERGEVIDTDRQVRGLERSASIIAHKF